MRKLKIDRRPAIDRRRTVLGAPLLMCVAFAFASVAQAGAIATRTTPRVITGGVSHVHGSSAELEGAINPRGAETTYYFQFGPTTAYGHQTISGTLPSGRATVKVSLPASVILPGYHYRLLASSGGGPAKAGPDRVFTTKATRLALAIVKPSAPVVLGSVATVSGTLSGNGGGGQRVVLQASHYPYLEPFSNLGLPATTNAAGRFSFQVPGLAQSTQFRVSTLTARPLFSAVITEHVAVRVTLKVRSAGRAGLVRLYGTVTPSRVGARVYFQVQKAARPGTRSEKAAERTVRFANQGSSTVKRATKTLSRFSSVLAVRIGGRYRAFVSIPGHAGATVSGASPTLVLHAAPASTLKAQKKRH